MSGAGCCAPLIITSEGAVYGICAKEYLGGKDELQSY